MADTKHYYDFHFPMPIVELILSLLGKKQNTPAPKTESGVREWFSQIRSSENTTTEVITTSFRLPLSVSEISLEILRMPCTVEVWYQDRSNQWKPMLDTQRSPLSVMVSRSDTKSWHKFQARCYPIVAKQVQFRLTRTPDPALIDVPYPVGLRNCLIRRNVYDRAQGGAFEDYVDIMGNVVTRTIKDWDASRAVDDNYTTFWKSAPQPDPAAVVSLYLDVRSVKGVPQVIDKVYLDPIYTGQHLNLYYSNDDAVGSRRISPVGIPGSAENMEWRPSTGLYDLLTAEGGSYYQFPFKIGPQIAQAAWIGIEWKPAFASASVSLAANPILFSANGDDVAWRPTIYYDPGSKDFRLQFFDGKTARVYNTDPIAADWIAGEPIRITAGWSYNPDRIWIKVVNQAGTVLAEKDIAPTTLPELVSFDGTGEFANVRGALTNVVVKLDDPTRGVTAFLANPTTYCDPDPVVRDETGRIPSTSLDNAVYTAPFVTREHGSGGADESHFQDKKWTPIWRDYVAIKGFLYLPRPVSMKYLKLEFTNLTEEPYPVYESGIETRYKVFPISVTQTSSIGPKLYTGEGGFLGLGTFISMNGVKSVNWLNPASVMAAVGAVMGPTTPPVIVNPGTPYVTTTMPNNGAQLVEDSRRIEAASRYVYARETLQPYVLAADQYNTIIKAEGLQAIQPIVDVPWTEIEAANPGAVTKVRSTGTVAIRGTDWWIYPGQQLKVPASVMTKLTDTQTVTERKLTLEHRLRFNTVSVHRYDYRTVKRDAAIAYFAGVREVQPFTSTYIPGEDKPVYDFPIYDPAQWTLDNHIIRATVDPAEWTLDPYMVSAVQAAADEKDKNKSFLGPIGIGLPGAGKAFKTLHTQSDFSRLKLDYRDSGLLRSNSLWATPSSDNLSDYLQVLPTNIPAGTWADITATWSDDETKWGSPYGIISATLNDERKFLGNRVLSFTRDGDPFTSATGNTGVEAGVSLAQHVNFVPQGLARLGIAYYKPYANTNLIRLRLNRASDNRTLYTETITPQVKRWTEHRTSFIEIPPTLDNGGFDVGDLTGWTPGGADTWVQDNAEGRSGPGSARIDVAAGGEQTLTTDKMLFFAEARLGCTAWVKWAGLTLSEPGTALDVKAVFYENSTVLAVENLTGVSVVSPSADSDWVAIGGSLTAPVSAATHVAFQVTVSDRVTGGTIWVDDVNGDVPGAERQSYNLELTVVGSDRETLLVSDLYTEIAPIRYFVQLGGEGSYLHDVTDLRYTKAETVVTSSQPVQEFSLRTVILSPKAWAFGVTATPTYLK